MNWSILNTDWKKNRLLLNSPNTSPPQRSAGTYWPRKSPKNLWQAQKKYKLRYWKATANMAGSKCILYQAQRKLKDLQDVLKQFTITAPKKGMLIYRRNWMVTSLGLAPHVNVWENIVAELPDLSSMIQDICEWDWYQQSKSRTTCQIGIDAFPEKKFTGKVAEVANIGEHSKIQNAKVFEVKIIIQPNSIPFSDPPWRVKNDRYSSDR